MKNINILISIFFFATVVFSQELSKKEYLIITYESSVNKGPHKKQNYFWIIESDKLEKNNKNTSPLYFEGYSKTLLDDCLKNKIVSPFNFYTDDKWNFTPEYLDLQKKMPSLIYENRIKIMTIRKKWNNKFKEKIRVYITPVVGEFCECPISENNGSKINYMDSIYFPIKNVKYNSLFDLKSINTYLLHKKMRTNDVDNSHY